MAINNLIVFGTISFIVSLVSSALLIPKINKLGFSLKVIDIPDKRKQHSKTLVRLGGVAIFLGFLITIISIIFISLINQNLLIDYYLYTKIFISAFLFFTLGLADDFFNMKPISRLLLQIIFVSFLFHYGIRLNGIEFNWFGNNESYILFNNFFAYLFTVLWIAGITNALNWLDGLDGLASGLSVISLLGMIIIFAATGKFDLVLICIAITGSTCGFLRYNFYPAKILMGDGGSYFLGSMLSTISILGLGKNIEINNGEYIIMPLFIAILLILIPITDMVIVMGERFINGYSVFYPDRRHLHYKLLRRGFHPRMIVIIFYGISQLFVCLAVILKNNYPSTILICSSIILFVFSLLYCINLKGNLE